MKIARLLSSFIFLGLFFSQSAYPMFTLLPRAYGVLGSQADASEAEVARSYRAEARKHHTDKGGDPRKWDALQAARELTGRARESVVLRSGHGYKVDRDARADDVREELAVEGDFDAYDGHGDVQALGLVDKFRLALMNGTLRQTVKTAVKVAGPAAVTAILVLLPGFDLGSACNYLVDAVGSTSLLALCAGSAAWIVFQGKTLWAKWNTDRWFAARDGDDNDPDYDPTNDSDGDGSDSEDDN